MKCVLATLIFLLSAVLPALAQQPGAAASATDAPSHPVTEATLRTYFEACHTIPKTQAVFEQQFEIQRSKLPPWFPPDVFTEMVQQAEAIDIVRIALPVYQKYYSEEATRIATHLVVTPAGQAMVNKLYDMEMQHIASGDSAVQAQQRSIAAVRSEEDAKVREMLSSLTPAQKREAAAFVQTAEWKRILAQSGQIQQEFNAALQARQSALFQQVAQRHSAELQQARGSYQDAHPGVDPDAPK